MATRPPPALGPEENDEEVVEVQIPAGEEDARSESFNEGKYLVYVNKKLSTFATASQIFKHDVRDSPPSKGGDRSDGRRRGVLRRR